MYVHTICTYSICTMYVYIHIVRICNLLLVFLWWIHLSQRLVRRDLMVFYHWQNLTHHSQYSPQSESQPDQISTSIHGIEWLLMPHTYMYVCTYIGTCIHTYIYTYVHVCTYSIKVTHMYTYLHCRPSTYASYGPFQRSHTSLACVPTDWSICDVHTYVIMHMLQN